MTTVALLPCHDTSPGTRSPGSSRPRELFRSALTSLHHYEGRNPVSVTRCATCGSPLPIEEDDSCVYVQAGSLDDPLGVGITHHIFCGSNVDWDFEAENSERGGWGTCVEARA